MPRISQVLAVPATGAYYHEDLSALQAAPLPSSRRTAEPATPGPGIVREVSEAVSVGVILDGVKIAWGDCVSVAYCDRAKRAGGNTGRAAALRAREGLSSIQGIVAPALEGRELTGFRELAAEVDALTETVTETRPIAKPPPDPDQGVEDASRRQLLTSMARLLAPVPTGEGGRREQDDVPTEKVVVTRRLHPAVRYGVSQALLKAVALARGVTMAEVVADEWGLPRPDAPVPIHAQLGSERYLSADRMIVRRVASLPHAPVDDIPKQVGQDGTKLTRYVKWLKGRIQELGGADYAPTIHLDLRGALGEIFGDALGRVLGHLYALELAAQPFPLRIECPVLMGSRQAQIEALKELRQFVAFRKLNMQLVASEWADTLEDIQAFVEAQAADMIQIKMPDLGSVHNSVDAVLACQAGGVGAFLGGSCAETDLAARVAVHVALATRPDIIMAKPGTGVDEAIVIVQNEMARALAWIQARGG